MKHRAICIVLILCLVCALLPTSAGAANVVASGTCGENAAWVITDDGVMTISGTGTITKSMTAEAFDEIAKTDAQIRSIVIGEGVTAIADSAFCNPPYPVETITLPSSLKAIGIEAFSSCYQLVSVSIPEGVTAIGAYAFANCYALKHITIPGSVKQIEPCTFSCCYGLQSVILEDGVTSVGREAFSLCTGMEDITLPDTLTSIDSDAFYSCKALTEIVIPGSVKKINQGIFSACDNLEIIILEEGVEEIAPHALQSLMSLGFLYLPDTIKTIGADAFSNCSNLQQIRLPAALAEIPNGLFFSCDTLQVIIIPNTVKTIGPYAFTGCNILSDVYFAGTEAQLNAVSIDFNGNEALASANIYLIPAMPDPMFGFFDMPAQDNWAYPGISFCLMNGLMNGVGNGYFQPNGTTTRAQLVTILWRLMGEPEATKPAPFTDLKQDWYREAVAWAAENNITNGTSAATFSPDMPVTREQMVTIFYRMCRDYLKMDVSPAASLAGFPDSASVSAWAQDAVQWAVAVKLISGVGDGRGNSYLQPQGSATRAQIATVMMNFVNAFGSEAEAEGRSAA